MSDVITAVTASGLIYTGRGYVAGLVVTANVGNPQVTIYDNTTVGGTTIFTSYAGVNQPIIIFFPEAFSPRFSIGLYIVLGTGMVATVWSRQL